MCVIVDHNADSLNAVFAAYPKVQFVDQTYHQESEPVFWNIQNSSGKEWGRDYDL